MYDWYAKDRSEKNHFSGSLNFLREAKSVKKWDRNFFPLILVRILSKNKVRFEKYLISFVCELVLFILKTLFRPSSFISFLKYITQ